MAPVTSGKRRASPWRRFRGPPGLAVFYMALGPSVVCYLIYYYALAHMEASRLSAFNYLLPPLATISWGLASGRACHAVDSGGRRGHLRWNLHGGARRDERVRLACCATTATTATPGSGRWSAKSATTSTTSRSSAWRWRTTRSGLVVSGVMLARAIPAVLAGPVAGVVLDRLNRKHVMIASDLIRAVVAHGFILTVNGHDTVAAVCA